MKSIKLKLNQIVLAVAMLATAGVAQYASAFSASNGTGGLWSAAVRYPHVSTNPNGSVSLTAIIVFQASSESACQAQIQPYMSTGGVLVRPCQRGMVNLDNVQR
jgi:hypothetical protein